MSEFIKSDWLPDLLPLPEGSNALEACVIIKFLDSDGDVTHAIRYSENLSAVESLGMLTAAKIQLENQLRHFWEDYDE
jgi:hypothetical protein